MVVAMKLLVRAALQEPLNQRFAFICEHTVPLYPATVIWQQLSVEPRSRMNACRPPLKDQHVRPIHPRPLPYWLIVIVGVCS